MDLTLAAGTLASVDDGATVLFDSVRSQEGLIAYNPATGVITIDSDGFYLVNWWVATDGAGPLTSITFSLAVNGVPSFSASSPIVTGQLTGTALVPVAGPSTLSLNNTSGFSVTIPPITSQAEITIVRVSSLL